MLKHIQYLSPLLLSIITIRIAVFGASIGDAITISALAGLYGYKQWLDRQEIVTPVDQFKEELNKVKEELGKVTLASISKPKAPQTNYKF